MGNAKNIPADTLLLPYQKKWVEDFSRLKIAEKSRQIGWTWATAYGLVRRKAKVDARLDAWISSRDDIQARLFLEDCKGFANLLQTGAQDLGERVIDDDGHSAYVLAMANTTRIHSMSSNPDAQAGKRGDRVLDEFALHPDPRKLYGFAFPGITWGGSLEVFSTHRGSVIFFNTLIREVKEKGNPKGFSLHTVTLQDALDQGFLCKLQAKLPADDERQDMDEAAYFDFIRSGCPDEEMFAQEYMCQPSDDATAFIDYALLDACKMREPVSFSQSPVAEVKREGARLYLGVDIGRHHDLTVLWLCEDVGGVLVTRQVVTLRKTPFHVQTAVLYDFLELPGLVRCCIDKNGLGEQLSEGARNKFGYRVEQVALTGTSKERMAYPLRSRMEDRKFLVPDDRVVFADFRGIRKTTTASGNIRFDGERTKDGHSDRFWAAALCVEAAGKPAGNFQPVPFYNRRAE
jgi:phage FluMu gp28-like protein